MGMGHLVRYTNSIRFGLPTGGQTNNKKLKEAGPKDPISPKEVGQLLKN